MVDVVSATLPPLEAVSSAPTEDEAGEKRLGMGTSGKLPG